MRQHVDARDFSANMVMESLKRSLWNKSEGADLVIRCRSRGGGEVHWKVHRRILVDMSEWMEKHMPPMAEDGSVVEWVFPGWDAGQLGAVLQYMYLEDFQGGVYDPNNPLNTEALIINTVHFLAATACLCRPMMDQAVDQIDDATEQIREKLSLLRHANLDEFEMSIRRALLIMYDEPDQWRIRALRIVMGKLMAVCFPLILQSHRWATNYQKWWGMMRVRVVADHRWLYQAGICQKSNVIVHGFEHMDVIWIKYRKDGWQPADDLMFPEREAEDRPAPTSAPATPAGGRKRSRAIPIVDPSGNITSVPGKPISHYTGHLKNYPHGDCTTQATPWSANEKATPDTKSIFETARPSAAKPTKTATLGSDASPAKIQSLPNVEDPFTGSSNTPGGPVFPDSSAPFQSAGGQAHIAYQHHPVFPPPFFMRPPPTTASSLPVTPQCTQGAARASPDQANQPSPILPWLPDGPFYFAETCIGEPATSFASQTANFAPPSVAGAPYTMCSAIPSVDGWSSSAASAAASVLGGSSSTSAAASSIDPLGSPTRRMTELKMAFDAPNDEPVDQQATPRAPAGNAGNAGNLNKDHERTEEDAAMWATLLKDEATPCASIQDQTELFEAASQQETTPTAAPATNKLMTRKLPY